MFSKLAPVALFAALAGRAFAFNVSINKVVYQSTEVIGFDFVPEIAVCQSNCTIARQAIDACSDIGCFCSNKTTIPLNDCEQCLFTTIVEKNIPAPDPRVGSNQILAGWTANCAAEKTPIVITPALALALPDSWDGPFVSVFPDAVGWVIAITGGTLGASLIYMLCNM
ncbi:hypothetical protein MKEN_00879700 [Mycena kentingensis (nom. inval.)]|nr:hypothetical protein MKEN_00879700 [Mycena kentingensis (nom. inval.)]